MSDIAETVVLFFVAAILGGYGALVCAAMYLDLVR